MKIRVLIVDDEALARERVQKMLASETEFEIAGECGNGSDAIAFIQKEQPDLVLLDVQMPEVNGFDVLRALPPGKLPAVIFITAYDQHAVEAFEVSALDYLLKPFKRARFQEALRRAAQHLQARDSAGVNRQLIEWLKVTAPSTAYLNRIAVKTDDRTIFVKVEDIEYVESASNYAVLCTRTGNHVLRETLTNLEAKLLPKMFLRISRSVIVNLKAVKELQPGWQGEHVIILHGGKQLTMTRGLREVQERLQYS
jgi:two-component system LytT family response regulator